MPGDSPSEPDALRGRAIGLFRYLNALAELRARTVRDVSAYDAFFWLSELPCEKECYTPAWDGEENTDEENWVRIDKPAKPARPQPPVECEHWFHFASLDDVSAEPKLHDEIADPGWIPPPDDQDGDGPNTLPPTLQLSDHPHVITIWNTYLQAKWYPWRVECQRWEHVQKAYRKLFAIYQEQQRRGEQYELLIGVGVLVWTTSSGHKVRRPIVTARVTIDLERESGCIKIAPAVDGASFTVEQEMLEINDRPPIQDQRQIEDDVSSLESLWNRAVITPILKGWLNSLPSAADAEYRDILNCPDGATRTPQMAFAPVLILRKRGAQTMRDFLKQVVKGLSEGKPIPRGVLALCSEVEDSDGRYRVGSEGTCPPEEILFPLPTNDEQLAIVRRLCGRSGVLVQGPPGTGKSHTIVNLVSHLLACGKRVLVTSQTPRALKVLREKIPEAILPLTVSLLGEDAESRQNLEHSVQGILRHIGRTNPDESQRQIEKQVRERHTLQGRLADLRRRLREVREAETTVHVVPGTSYQGTAQAIAESVSHDRERLCWLTDEVAEDMEPPITDDEFRELTSLWGSCQYGLLAYTFPSLDALPTSDDLANADAACSRATRAVAQISRTTDVTIAQALLGLGRETLLQLCKMAQRFIQLSEWLAARTEPWIDRVRQEVCEGRALTWTSLESATSNTLKSLAASADKWGDAELTAPTRISRTQVLADATDLLSHLESAGTLGFWIFRAPVVKRCRYLWEDSRFGGRLCDSPAVLKSLLIHLRGQVALDRVWREWSVIAEAPNGTVRHRIACLEQHRDVLQAVLQLGSHVFAAQKVVGYQKPADNHEAAISSDWGHSLLRNARLAIALLDVRDAQAALAYIRATVSEASRTRNPHPIVSQLVDSVAKGDVVRYQEQLTSLSELQRERALAERCLSLDKKLRAFAPELADRMKVPETRAALAEHLDSFTKAWRWRRAEAWLERFAKEHSTDIADELHQTKGRLHKATQTLVALKAWQSCMGNLSSNPAQQGALTAWQQMVKKIGKGKGKYAETYRRDARKYMQQCRNAIPAWIMPLYRVAEQVEAEPEVFDVVIVDEASQTGPEGLILQYLAKQCVIVGDDKQISPEGAFVERSQTRTLMEQHLSGIPFSETLDPLTSLFDQAAVRYGNRIALREHFRCMPEIIRFSNELCYTDTPLIPLRQYPPSRLPAIQVRYVTDGYREGTSQQVINRPEAAAVAKAVIDCLGDTHYQGKSFGVICLQGHAQSQLIENMVLDKVGPHPFKDETTRLLCGDPYSFQGDERDIVFLSMVASAEGEARSAPLTRETFRQRFNVAASRPRDQVWLFHSIREGDLHPECMRRRLLHFYYNPDATTVNADGRDYESGFERDVAEALIRTGFHVIPQYEVAGKRIDLVVQDKERRIAVECDGDAWHGPDRYDADMARQRMLERCGWKFLRIRGSLFYANRARAIGELVNAIRAHGIQSHVMAEQDAGPRDWVQEVSGNDCMEALGTHAVDVADENIVQGEFFRDEQADDPEKIVAGTVSTQPPFTDDDCGAIVACLKNTKKPLKVAQLAWRTKIPTDNLERFLSTLIELGWIVRTGSNCDGRYKLVAVDLEIEPEVGIAIPTASKNAHVESITQAIPPAAVTPGADTLPEQPQPPQLPGARKEAQVPTIAPNNSAHRATESVQLSGAASKPPGLVVTAVERAAIKEAMEEAGRPLVMWLLAQRSGITEWRMEKILPVLVDEGFVRRIASADADRYSQP